MTLSPNCASGLLGARRKPPVCSFMALKRAVVEIEHQCRRKCPLLLKDCFKTCLEGVVTSARFHRSSLSIYATLLRGHLNSKTSWGTSGGRSPLHHSLPVAIICFPRRRQLLSPWPAAHPCSKRALSLQGDWVGCRSLILYPCVCKSVVNRVMAESVYCLVKSA